MGEEEFGEGGGGGGNILLLLCLFASLLLYHKITNWRRKKAWEAAPKGVVVLHCLPPGVFAPSLSPFVLKVMTFLRYAKLPHQLDDSQPMGPRGLTPWVTLDGEVIEDSEVIIATLTRRFAKEEKLSPVEEALSISLSTMMDHHFAWCLRVYRYDWDQGRGVWEGHRRCPWYYHIGVPLMCYKLRLALWHQGLGRHNKDTIINFVREDLRALALCLGEKRFLLGEEARIIDTKVFGFLAGLYYNYQRSPFHSLITDEFPSLVSYVERMKATYWPDWNSCLDPQR